MGQMRRTWVAAPVAAGVMAWAAAMPAHADLTATVDAGIGYSDNLGRVPDNETSETIGTAGLELEWRERSRRIRGDATVDLSYFEYLDDTYDGELLGTANGTLALAIVPEHLRWVFEDSFGQAQSDPFAPRSPENREDLNYFATGPDLTLRLGTTGFGRLFGRWAMTSYEDSPFDSERSSAGVAVGRRATPRSELSLNAVTESVDFEQDFNTDFDRDSVFIGWNLDAARTNLDAQLGYTWLERDGAEEQGSALINVVITRELTASSQLALTLGSQLGDAGDSLRTQLEGAVLGGGAQITATSDPFEQRLVSLDWRYQRGRTGFSLGASWSDEEYETQLQFDRTRYVYSAAFTRQLAGTVDFELRGTLENEEFQNVDLTSDEARLEAVLNWRAWRTLGLRLTLERFDRNTSSGLGEFVENRGFLTVAYYWGARAAQLR